MSVTAFPVILIDSATGSDSLASGAGPSTALTGTNGVSNGAGTTVTLDSGTVLTGVATDGSHVLYFADATAGNRNFAAINGSSGSGGATPTITLEQAVGATLTKSWAIGGKRAALGSTTTGKLYNNNSAAGDAMPGWVLQLADGHSETIGSGGGPEGNGRVWFRRAGDTTSGRITLRGANGASVKPKITFGNAGAHGIYTNQDYITIRDFTIENSNATKNEAAITEDGMDMHVIGMTIGSSSNPWNKGVVSSGAGRCLIRKCDIGWCKTTSVEGTAGNGGFEVLSSYLHDMPSGATAAVYIPVAFLSSRVSNNIIYNNACHGILQSAMRTVADCTFVIEFNTIDSSGTSMDGIQISAAGTGAAGLTIINNILSNNGGYGLNFNNATYTDGYINGVGITVLNNNTYNNTSGAYKSNTAGYTNSNCPWASGDPGLNPSYVGGGDFTPQTAGIQAAYPSSVP